MSLSTLPDDCLLACLARVPYADLRNGIPSTSKQLRDAVASAAFRKTREAAGCVEWALFAGEYGYNDDFEWEGNCYLITASGAHITAPPLPGFFGHDMMRLVRGDVDEIAFVGGCEESMGETPRVRTQIYDPRRNSWREVPRLLFNNWAYSARNICFSSAGKIMLLSEARRVDVYDSSQDEWSWQMANLPLDVGAPSEATEVDGKLWRYAADDTLEATSIYDPATQTWTDGPRLPYELWVDIGGMRWHTNAFELRKRFCIMGFFQLQPLIPTYAAFSWDPTDEAWERVAFNMPPVVALRTAHYDDYLFVSGYRSSETERAGSEGHNRLFVLTPGSRDWTEWTSPNGMWRGHRLAAVRIG